MYIRIYSGVSTVMSSQNLNSFDGKVLMTSNEFTVEVVERAQRITETGFGAWIRAAFNMKLARVLSIDDRQ